MPIVDTDLVKMSLAWKTCSKAVKKAHKRRNPHIKTRRARQQDTLRSHIQDPPTHKIQMETEKPETKPPTPRTNITTTVINGAPG